MTNSEKARNLIRILIVAAAIASLIVKPVPIQIILVFAAVGIVAGGLWSLRGTVASVAGAAVLLLATEWIQSLLDRRGFDVAWYAPILLSASFAIVAHLLGQFLRVRAKPSHV